MTGGCRNIGKSHIIYLCIASLDHDTFVTV